MMNMNKGEIMTEYKIGDRIEFTKGFRKGEKGVLVGLKNAKEASFAIAGIPWYSIKMDGGYVISGQFEGDFKKIGTKER